ncbi:MAG: hypothetical protein MZW92_00110 [Comamonadaceae bacterium]|nr:hypothetical protein [Comamonadaceae bacterium]
MLLPGTPLDEAQQALTRLQRSLTASLFLHEGERGVRHLLRRRDRRGAPARRWRRRSSAPTRRCTRPSGPARTAPARS